MNHSVAASIKHVEEIKTLAAGLSSSDHGNDEILSQLAQYLAVRVSGLIEVSVKALLLDVAMEKTDDPGVLAFVQDQLDRHWDLNVGKICELLGHFHRSWGTAAENTLVGPMKESINSVVSIRNALAHGEDATISFGEVSKHNDHVLEGITALATICNPKAISWFIRPVALLVIGMQRRLFAEPTPVYRGDQVLENINALVDRAHADGAPVFCIQHSTNSVLMEGSKGWQLLPALRSLKTDHFISAHHENAFKETRLKTELDALGIARVVVVGLLTDHSVQATCKSAHALYYDVSLVEDAHSTNSPDSKQAIDKWNAKLSPSIVRLQTAADVDFRPIGTK